MSKLWCRKPSFRVTPTTWTRWLCHYADMVLHYADLNPTAWGAI